MVGLRLGLIAERRRSEVGSGSGPDPNLQSSEGEGGGTDAGRGHHPLSPTAHTH